MKVLLDTNIIVDIALERQPYITNSETVLAFVEQGQIEDYISASTISAKFLYLTELHTAIAKLSDVSRQDAKRQRRQKNSTS